MTVALGLGAFEIGFRALVDVTDIPFFFWDPAIGPRIAPNQSGTYRKGAHVDGRYRFNSRGWNHPEDYVVAKPPGTQRICLVGDSTVESLHVRPHETMYAVAERLMNIPVDSSQWYAFGVSGFGTAEQYEVIRRYVLDYSPDLVILLFVHNDPSDSSPYIRNLAPYTVRYFLDKAGELAQVFPVPWKPIWWRRLVAQSAVVRYFMVQRGLQAYFRRTAGAKGIGGHPLREIVEGASGAIVPGLANMSLEERQRKTWMLLEALLKAIRDESERRGARFALAFRGWAEEIDSPIVPEEIAEVARAVDPHCLGTRAREMGREQLASIAARLEIPYLDLTGPLQSAVRKTGKSHRFPDDNHYSTLGHAAAGKALASWAEGILGKAPVAVP
jgi:lysophospholipase L1-like esterase